MNLRRLVAVRAALRVALLVGRSNPHLAFDLTKVGVPTARARAGDTVRPAHRQEIGVGALRVREVLDRLEQRAWGFYALNLAEQARCVKWIIT